MFCNDVMGFSTCRMIRRGTTVFHSIAFNSTAEKTSWMADFTAAKKKFGESKVKPRV